MNTLPATWCTGALGLLIDRIDSGLNVKCEERPPLGDEKGLVKISAVTWGRFNQDQSKTLPFDAELSESARISKGDLLISRANTIELVGASVIVERIEKRLYLSDKVLRLVVPNESKRWVNYVLKTPAVRKAIEANSSGNQLSMRNISQDKLRSIDIPLAPLPEQKRIADKLDTVLARVNACRERLNRVPLILKRFRQSVLAAATSGQLTADWRDARRLDETHCNLAGGELNDWKRTNVGEILEGIQAGLNLQCKERPPEPHERGLVKISAVTWGRYNDEESKTLPDEFIPNESIKIEAGDFLISRANTLELVGACVIVDKVTRPVYLSDKVLRLVMPESIKKWMLYCLRSRAGRDQIENLASGNQLSMRNLSQANLKSILISLPSKIERLEIVRRVEVLFAFADRLEARLATARAATDRLTPALLAKAFRGELVPQDPNDEPAAELLKRLAVARTATSDKPHRGRAAKVEKRPSDHPNQVAIAEI
jgi:type I restriction enzyme, S subunit